MEITVKKLTAEYLEEALWVEQHSMKGGWYLEDNAELFFGDTVGPMLGAFVEGKLVGIAKYTVLYDHTAWLEILRVHPDYQRKGVGRRLYEEFVKLSKEKHIPSMAMYTGVQNVASAALARQFGLDTAGVYREAALDLQGQQAPAQVADFELVDGDEACRLLDTLKERNKGFLIFNRTFMHMNEALYRGLAAEGKVYCDRASGSFMAFGNRFLPKRSVQIGIMHGDLQKCLDFAKAKGLERGVPQVILMFPPEDTALQALLEQNGYKMAASDLQVMEGAVR